VANEFVPFGKIARLNRECVITEKIDGTNASIYITEDGDFFTGSRTRWITPEEDNAGFSKWANENKDELMKLGKGHHFGEWYGQKIQRAYGLTEKRFALFNTSIWSDDAVRPTCCCVVPVLYRGLFTTDAVKYCLDLLRTTGSVAVKGFMRPEGVVIYHVAGNLYFKATIEKDDEHKSMCKE
jgi:hypothetical protein